MVRFRIGITKSGDKSRMEFFTYESFKAGMEYSRV